LRKAEATLENLKDHTRVDIMELANQGHLFLEAIRSGTPLDNHKVQLQAWISQLKRLVHDGVSAADRMAFDGGLIALQEFFGTKGSAMGQNDLIVLVGQMAYGLDAIRRSYTFKRVEVADDKFAAFLRAAQFEDKQLCMGEALSLSTVGKTSKVDAKMARGCLARLLDESLGYELADEEEKGNEYFQIDYERVQFTLDEMATGTSRNGHSKGATQNGNAALFAWMPNVYHHFASELERFHNDDPFDRSVFVMMKFPDSAAMNEWQLQCLEDIYSAVKDELYRHGLVARRADKKTYATSKQLWDNLCIYLLGCRFGVAILEDHVGDELNPNVALEYGFMKGLGREVVLLKERRFKHLRADLVGTIPKDFDIGSDHALDKRSIQDAIANWLTDIGVPPKHNR
jgi:hypothetical protein